MCPCMQMSWGGPNLIVKQDYLFIPIFIHAFIYT